MPLPTLHDLYHSKPVQEKLIHNKQQFNKYVRQDPLCNMVKLDKLYKPNTPFIGLNPHLDEIYFLISSLIAPFLATNPLKFGTDGSWRCLNWEDGCAPFLHFTSFCVHVEKVFLRRTP